MQGNVQSMRNVADMIERNSNMYNQVVWGDANYSADVAGQGIDHNCGTPACIAGFAIQYAGEKNAFMEVIESNGYVNESTRGKGDVDSSTWGKSIIEYGLHILGLENNKDNAKLFSTHWPEEWLDESKPIRLEDGLTIEHESRPPNAFIPSSEDAVSVLRRLAYQIEVEQKAEEKAQRAQEEAIAVVDWPMPQSVADFVYVK